MNTRQIRSLNINTLRIIVLICFMLSGMSALIYEILWMRLISRVIGGAPFAVASILIIFMGGIGIGSYISGKKTDSLSNDRLVRYYGVLELVIGLYACLAPLMFLALKGPVSTIYNSLFGYTIIYNLIIFIFAFIVLFIPVACMGATLPVLCRFYVSALPNIGSSTGRLYGLNTIGGAAGTLLCGFFLIQNIGVWGTMIAALAINLSVGAFCVFVSYRYRFITPDWQDEIVPDKKSKSKVKKAAAQVEAGHGGEVLPAIIIFMVSGFCAMACEVFWTKLLGLVIGPTTYSFTIVLVTFIIGLAIGNFVFGILADSSANLIALLIVTQVTAAITGLVASHYLGNSQLFFAKLIYTHQNSFIALNMLKGFSLFMMMLLPTFFFGASFPIVARICTRSLSVIGDSVGRAYAFNTLGCVLGSFAAGFLLIPFAGKETGLKAVFFLQILVSAFIALYVMYRRGVSREKYLYPALALIAGTVICLNIPSWSKQTLSVGKYHRFKEMGFIEEIITETGWLESFFSGSSILSKGESGELVYYGEGIGGFTTVLKYPMPLGGYEFSMANSGKMDASSHGDMKTQTLLAHFPMMFSDDPQNVMVLGLASGITAGEVLHYPVKAVDIVEINSRVFEACGFFGPWNNNILSSPRSRLIAQDGIAHLALTSKKYDVIISEPSNPWMAGMASLFTKEFFELAKSRLTEKGLYVQWFHCYQMDWETFSLVGRTFASVFPEGVLVNVDPSGSGRDFLFVGSKKSSPLNIHAARKNIRHAQGSKNISIASPEILYRLVLSENLGTLFGDGVLNQDDRPRLEYAAPKLMYQPENSRDGITGLIKQRSVVSADTVKFADWSRRNTLAQRDFARFALSVNTPFDGMFNLSAATESDRVAYTSMLKNYSRRYAINTEQFSDARLKKDLRDIQISAIESGIDRFPSRALSYKYLAQLYLQGGMRDNAVKSYLKAIEADPEDARVHNDLGFLFYELGDGRKAETHYNKALSIRPNFLVALGNLGYLNLSTGNHAEAVKYFKETLRLKPDLAESHYNIGFIYFKEREYHGAVKYLKNAVRYKPDMTDALNSLAWIYSTATDTRIRNPKLAVKYASHASKLSGNSDPLHLATLAVALNSAGRRDEAFNVARRAFGIAKKTGRNDILELIGRALPEVM